MSARRVRTRLAAAAAGGALALALAPVGGAPAHAADPQAIPSTAETVPGSHTGDTIDDPAIWVHPTDPSRSLVMANDKLGAFDTYDLDGNLVQRLTSETRFWGNVDVRQGVTVGSTTHDLVGVVNGGAVRFFRPDPATLQLSPVTEGSAPVGANGEGFCLYESPTTQRVYGIVITRPGTLRQFELRDADDDGLLEATVVRTLEVGSEAEGCVADDTSGALYVSEEDVALWRYDAEPSGGSTRTAVDVVSSAGGRLAADIEGVTLVEQPGGAGYLIASAQNVADPNSSYFAVYRREAGNAFVKTFRITNGTDSDDCDRTDGVAATTADLGPAFPRGVFVCQDNNNDLPGTAGNQDLKLTRLETVVDLGAAPPPPPGPPPAGDVEVVGVDTVNRNSTRFTVDVPDQARAGDLLLLLASEGNTEPMVGPGAGWTQLGRQTDSSHATTVWSRTATAGDAGSPVTLDAQGRWTKAALTLAVYRGTDPDDPVAGLASAPEPGTSTSHTTPTVTSSEPVHRVSYFSDKTMASTGWTAPAGETTRAATNGTGGGRIGSLLTDHPDLRPAGSHGGLTATATAPASKATTWTLLLRPAAGTDPPPPPPPPPDQDPTAVLSADCTGLTCDFDATGSSDPEGGALAYSWSFGDGGTSTRAQVTHTYGAGGDYPVTLVVSDPDGNRGEDATTVSVAAAPPPPSTGPVEVVGVDTVNRNSTRFTVEIPDQTRADDLLLLLVSEGNTAPMVGPGPGWTQVGRQTDSSHATTVWSRTATAADAGTSVSFDAEGRWTKAAVTLVAYRGLDPADPLAAVASAPEPGDTRDHTTPTVASSEAVHRVSYFSDKTMTSTGWTAPAGETVQASTNGTGGGRIGSLLTDHPDLQPAGTHGGLTATATGPATKATTWTLLLRPAG